MITFCSQKPLKNPEKSYFELEILTKKFVFLFTLGDKATCLSRFS